MSTNNAYFGDTNIWPLQCDPDPFENIKLSEKKRERFIRMQALIIASPHGPHPPSSPFPPSYNLSDLSTKPFSKPVATSVSQMMHNAGLRLVAQRVLNKPRTMFNRSRTVKVVDEEKEDVEEVVWGEDSSWGNTSVGSSGVEKLREVGIVVERRELSWEEQLVVEVDPFRCFESSGLNWSWRVMGEEELDEEEKKTDEEKEWDMDGGEEGEEVVEEEKAVKDEEMRGMEDHVFASAGPGQSFT